MLCCLKDMLKLDNKSNNSLGEKIIESLLGGSALITILVTIGIIYVLFSEGIHFFETVSISEFLTSTEWTPTFSEKHYGIAPLLAGTITTTLIAIAIAIPIGVTIAIYLSLYAPDNLRNAIKPALEVLAAVPTVVYGFFALTIITPFLKENIFGDAMDTNNALSAGIVMAIMILPLISSLSEDAINSVPKVLKEASYGMGATRLQTAFKVLLPAASSGIIVSVILAISRAIGETMIVAVAAGSKPTWTFNPLKEVQTVTTYMVSTAKSDVQVGDTAYYAIFSAGIALFIFTFGLNVISFYIKKSFKNKYE